MSTHNDPNVRVTRAGVKKYALSQGIEPDNLLYEQLTVFHNRVAIKPKSKDALPVTCTAVDVYKPQTFSTNAAVKNEDLIVNKSFSLGSAIKGFFTSNLRSSPTVFNPTLSAEKCLINISALSEHDKISLLDTAINCDKKQSEGSTQLISPEVSIPAVYVENACKIEDAEINSVTKDIDDPTNDFWWDSSYTDLNNDCLCDAIEVSAVIDEFHWINSTELSVNDFDDLALNTAILASPTDDNKPCVFDSYDEDLSIFTNAFVSHDNTVLGLNNDVQTYINQIVGVNEKELNILHIVYNFETVSIPVSCENPPSPETKPFTLFSSPA